MQSLHLDTLKSQGKHTNTNIFGYLSLCPILSVNTPAAKEVTHLQTQNPNQLPPPNDWNSSEDVADEITASSTND